jgi:hypothetical protein
VTYADGSKAYIDVKMMATEASTLRRKLFENRYATPLLWIAKSLKYAVNGNPWIPYDNLVKLRRATKKKKEAQ